MAHLAHQPLVDDDEPTTRLPNPWPLQRKVLVGAVSICAGLVLLAVLAKPAPTIHQKTALSCGSTVTGSTVRGPRHLGQASGDATFGFVVGTTTTVTFSTCAETNFDSYLHVYDQSLREIAFDDDGCGSGFRARLQTTLNPVSLLHALLDLSTTQVGFCTLVPPGFIYHPCGWVRHWRRRFSADCDM
eukprot:c10207_g1_i1.p2 GENE.c10207_g1_i1~~c10207_g1_i1.p2  ORF type:complete len:187 (+),score=20.55 c10207_g1_i1:69-629(+)